MRAACNAHARRKFENATDYPADRKKWLTWYWLLFDLESEAKEQLLEGEALLSFRRAKQKPVWDLMRAELDSIDDRIEQVVLPKSDLRKALNYLRNHWVELTRYLCDPELPLDNNLCEQLMRNSAPQWGRKDRLFNRAYSNKSGYFRSFTGISLALPVSSRRNCMSDTAKRQFPQLSK